MKRLMKVFSFFSRKFFVYAIVVFAVVLISVLIFSDGNGKQRIAVTKKDLVQEVAITGKVKPNQSVKLGFDRVGRIAAVYAFVGDYVKRGQIIATLESGEILADLTKAKASLSEEKIKLRGKETTTPNLYNDAYKNLDIALRDGFVSADDAVRNKADQFFKNVPDNPYFEIRIVSGNFIHYFNVPTNITVDLNDRRKTIEILLNNWQKRFQNLDNTTNLIEHADKSISDLKIIADFLDKMAEAVNSFTSADYAYDTTVNSYKTTISSARGSISGALSAIILAKDKLNSLPTRSETGQFEDVLAQNAKVAQMEAVVASLESSLEKFVIKAPFDGIIVSQDAKVGETVSPGMTLVSMTSQNDFYVEASVSEIHIGKIKVGNPATIVFDAFPGEEFYGGVSYIEPSDIVIDGVVNYKIRVEFKDYNSNIRNGLTANLKIETMRRNGALAVPAYAVIKERDGRNFVKRVTTGNNFEKIPVSLGMLSSDGFVEILEGLKENEVVEF